MADRNCKNVIWMPSTFLMNLFRRMTTGWNWIKGNDGKLRCYYFESNPQLYRPSGCSYDFRHDFR